MNIGIRGSKSFLNIILEHLQNKGLSTTESNQDEFLSKLPDPTTVGANGYVIVLNATGNFAEGAIDEHVKCNLEIAEDKNAIFISWTEGKNEKLKPGDNRFDTVFSEE